MNDLVTLDSSTKRKLASQFNSRRAIKDLKFATELSHMERHLVNNSGLRDCDMESIGQTVVEAASLGLSMHPTLGHAYPIPYNINGQKRCELKVGYRGLIHRCMQAETIKSVQAVLVHEKDPTFRVWTDENGNRRIHHEEARKDRGGIEKAYCIAHFTNGGMHIEVMDREELDQCEAAAKKKNAKGGAVWGQWRGEMCKKSVVRRAWKYWPDDAEQTLAQLSDAMDRIEPMDFGDEPEVTISEEQVNELHAMLVEKGLPEQKATKFLERYADVQGLSEIGNLPASKFEDAKTQLKGYVEQWKKHQ